MNYAEQFTDFLRYQGRSENTIRSYQTDLEQFFSWAKSCRLKLEAIKIRDIDLFLIDVQKRGAKTQTVNSKAYCLKSFFRFLVRIEKLNRNPMEAFRNLRQKKELPRYLTQSEQEALLAAAGDRNYYDHAWIAQRNHLIILTLLDAGLRIGELCDLELSRINLEDGVVRISGKSISEREVVLSQRLKGSIMGYLEMLERSTMNYETGPLLASRGYTLKRACQELGIPYTGILNAITGHGVQKEGMEALRKFMENKILPRPIKFLFFNRHGGKLERRHAFRIVKDLGTKAGISDLHPHVLRHTFATNLRGRGCDLLLLKEVLGHSSVATTEIYAHLGDGQRRSELKRLVNMSAEAV